MLVYQPAFRVSSSFLLPFHGVGPLSRRSLGASIESPLQEGRPSDRPASRIGEQSSPTNNRAFEPNLFHRFGRRLGRRLAHASRVSIRNPPRLYRACLRARSWFGSEC